MKKITSYILTLLVLVSCNKELDINSRTSVDVSLAKTHLDLLLVGAYALIGSGAGTTGPNISEGALYSTDLLLNADLLASEDYVNWRGTFDQYKEVSNKLMAPTNTTISRMWTKGYAAINLANIMLSGIDNSPVEEKDFYKAQALFIRGIVHFELLRFWMEPSTGLGIPIITEPTESYENVKAPSRNTIAECYTSILADLTEAKGILSDDEDVFANTYTVSAFLARVYLYKGDYAAALTESANVIDSEKYELPASVEDAFNTDSSPESIFEIKQTTQNNAGTANDGLTTFYSCDVNTPGSAGRGDVEIDPKFMDLYDPADKRLTKLIYTGDCNKGSTTSGKWRNPYTNIPIIRLSEMYLIHAEASIRTNPGDTATPKADVNAILAKAGLPDYYSSVTLNDVLLERELELAFEGQRIHDFKRTDKQITYLGDPLKYSDPQFILPIPQSELNTNKNIQQNTYYK